MGKNIVICCDGTGNSFEIPETESNVAKLYGCLEIHQRQVGYYHPGVGTMGSPNSRGAVSREWSRIKGLAFGSGLLANIGDAYRYLMNTYADGDDIYLIGFSRGAFTARALASLIHVYGLLCPGNEGAIPYILRMYAKTSRDAKHKRQTFEPDKAFQWQFSHTNEVRIKFCGIWDTVSSYGWIYNPIQLPFLGVNPIILTGRHAVSIHERRCFYRDNLWGAAQEHQDIRQVWFAGVHSDIGGSYPESQSGLSKIPLEWMLVEARKAGLHFNDRKTRIVLGLDPLPPELQGLPAFVRPNAKACIHRSLKDAWWLLECIPQEEPRKGGKRLYVPLGRPRTVPQDAIVHASVYLGPHCPPSLHGRQREPWVPWVPGTDYHPGPEAEPASEPKASGREPAVCPTLA